MVTRIGYEVNINDIIVPLSEDKSNVRDFVKADVVGGRSFVLNDGGYPLNDIDLVIKQQDVRIQDSLLSQLVEVPTTGVPAATPNDEVLMSLRSRYQQTPSEMVRFYERQLEIYESRAQASQSDKTESTISFKTGNDVVEEQ